MANHAYVKARKNMTPERISEIIDTFNKKHLKGKLVVEYTASDDPARWGPHTWLLKYVEGEEWGRRVCWLNTRRSFEMRHGGGSDFMWWIDTFICNEIALEYNGLISDDGIGDKWKGEPGKYDSFKDYLDLRFGHFANNNPAAHKEYMKMVMEMTPPDFRFEV